MADFNKIIDTTIALEGGSLVTNLSSDKGKLTKYGISQKAYPNLDIANLSLSEAKVIYKKDYWDKLSLDLVSSQKIANNLFDSAVNLGTTTVARMTQKILSINPIDGILGSKSIEALNKFPEELFIKSFKLEKIQRYLDICNSNKSQTTFLLGWLNRTLKDL